MSAIDDRHATELLERAARYGRAALPTPDARTGRRIEERVRAQYAAMENPPPNLRVVVGGSDGTPCYQPGVAIESTTITVMFEPTTVTVMFEPPLNTSRRSASEFRRPE